MLDDITTSLDNDSSKYIPKLIANLKREHTIILITRKPEIMMLADKIVVLDKGHVNDIGIHDDLIKSNDIYKMLWSRKSPSRMGVFKND